LILVLTVLSVAASLWIASARLEVRTAQLELVSARLPLIAKSDVLENFGFHGKTTFTLVVQSPTQDRAIEFIRAMAEKIHADPEHFQEIFYRIDPDEIKKWLLHYLDEDDLVQIRDTLSEHSLLLHNMSENPDLLNFIRFVNQEMASRMVGEMFTGFLDDEDTQEVEKGEKSKPMDLEFLIKVLGGFSKYLAGTPKFVSPWSSFFKSGAWDLQKEGYIWEGNKKFLIAAVIPSTAAGGVSKTQKSLTKLRTDISELRASGFGDVKAGVTGQAALNDDEMTTAMDDMTIATWASLLGVLLIMLLFLRGFRHPIIIFISLTVGLCWTFGWTAVFIGHLNILSIVFAPMLCGLGVDYAIHWFARYEEELDLFGGSRSAIIRRVTEKSGPGIMLAGLSTAFSFLPFILTGFRGLMELGLITGMGILLTVFADFTVLPALSVYFAVQKPSRRQSKTGRSERYLLSLHPTGVRTVLAVSLALCSLGVVLASHVPFDLNPLRLQSRNAESVVWEKVLVENATHSIISAAAVLDSPEKVKIETDRLKALPTVSDVDNVFTLLPSRQEEKLPLLRSIALLVPDLNPSVIRLVANINHDCFSSTKQACDYESALIEVLQRIRFKMQEDQAEKWGASRPVVEQIVQIKELIDRISGSLSNTPSGIQRLSEYRTRFDKDMVEQWSLIKESSSASPMTVKEIPPQLRDQFLHENLYLLRIYPKESIWNEGTLKRFVSDIERVDPDVMGDPIALHVFASAFKKASIDASIYALISISLLLVITLRSLMLISLIPLAAGTIWTVGIMGTAGFDFNLANSIFMPLVVGAGVEYGVIIIQRWKEGRTGYGRLSLSTGKGVILAALTTTIGFGTLMISNHRGIFSLGFVAWAGSICVLLAALFIVPAILSIVKAPVQVSKMESIALFADRDVASSRL